MNTRYTRRAYRASRQTADSTIWIRILKSLFNQETLNLTLYNCMGREFSRDMVIFYNRRPTLIRTETPKNVTRIRNRYTRNFTLHPHPICYTIRRALKRRIEISALTHLRDRNVTIVKIASSKRLKTIFRLRIAHNTNQICHQNFSL